MLVQLPQIATQLQETQNIPQTMFPIVRAKKNAT